MSQRYECRSKNTNLKKEREDKCSVLQNRDSLKTGGQRTGPHQGYTHAHGKGTQSRAVQTSSRESTRLSKQWLLYSTHAPGAEFQVLNLDNTAGISAVSLRDTRGSGQLLLKMSGHPLQERKWIFEKEKTSTVSWQEFFQAGWKEIVIWRVPSSRLEVS